MIDDFIFAKLVWLTAQNTKRGVNMAARRQYEAVVRQVAAAATRRGGDGGGR